MVIEGMLALTGQHFIIDYNEREGTLPGFVEGFTNVARDEHRHVAFGARFLRDMAREDPRYAAAIQRALAEVAPVAEGVLKPKWAPATTRTSSCSATSGRGDARVRAQGARAAHEGHRARRGRLRPPEAGYGASGGAGASGTPSASGGVATGGGVVATGGVVAGGGGVVSVGGASVVVAGAVVAAGTVVDRVVATGSCGSVAGSEVVLVSTST